CRRRTRGEAPIVRGEVLPAVRLDAHPSPAIPVDPGLDGVDLALGEDVVARGMEERRLVPLEAEAEGKVVPVAGRRDDFAREDARTHPRDRSLPGPCDQVVDRPLPLVGLATDGVGPGEVGPVAVTVRAKLDRQQVAAPEATIRRDVEMTAGV